MLRRRTALALTALSTTVLPALAACGGSEPAAPSTATGGDAASALVLDSAAPSSWTALETTLMGHRLTVSVSPVLRLGETGSALALGIARAEDDVTAERVAGPDDVDPQGSGADVVPVADYLATSSVGEAGGASGVTLVDTASERVWVPTSSLSRVRLDLEPGQSLTTFVPFGPVEAETVTVMIPQTGFVRVPVIAREEAGGHGLDAAALETALSPLPVDDGTPEALRIRRFSRAQDQSGSTSTSEESVTVTLAADVAFAVGSSWLSREGEARLRTVSTQIAQYSAGGTIDIVGHTDDTADEASNQRLSEERAASVHDRLEQLSPLEAWRVTVSGKGESEPAVAGTDDAARAANRRVVITITPSEGTAPQAGAEPSGGATGGADSQDAITQVAAQGPVAPGPTGVSVTNPHDGGQGALTITLPQVERSDAFLLARLTLSAGSNGSGESTKIGAWLQYAASGSGSPRNEAGSAAGTGRSSTGLTLLHGDERLYPADFIDPRLGRHVPLTETMLGGDLEEELETTVCVIWPDTGQGSVTLDHPSSDGADGFAFRLTAIPVVEA